MRVKVELHRDVVRFIRHECTEGEVRAFYEKLEQVRSEPIGTSEAVSDPKLSRYILRFFRFGRNLALFEYQPANNLIVIRECRRAPQGQGGEQRSGDAP